MLPNMAIFTKRSLQSRVTKYEKTKTMHLTKRKKPVNQSSNFWLFGSNPDHWHRCHFLCGLAGSRIPKYNKTDTIKYLSTAREFCWELHNLMFLKRAFSRFYIFTPTKAIKPPRLRVKEAEKTFRKEREYYQDSRNYVDWQHCI